MKNELIYKFKNTVKLKISGKNIERYIKRIISMDIEILDMKKLKYNEVSIKINKEDYKRILEVKSIYEVDILDLYGMDKIKKKLKNNRFLIVSIIVSFLFIYYLSNIIFSIEVIHNNESLRNLIIDELRENDVRVYGYKKNYSEIEQIKTKILSKYKDKIEWLEIENKGTKYIIKVEERIIKDNDNNYTVRDIIASKDALLISIEAINGEIIRNKNEYVKKGDTIITGSIKLYDEVKKNVMAEGVVYGEVWYKATVEYPLSYIEEKETNIKNKVYVFKIGNRKFEILNLKKFSSKKIKTDVIFKHLFLPIELVVEKQTKIIKIKENISKEEAEEKAINLAKNKIISKLSDKEYIIDTKKLKVEANDSKIVIDIFFSVCEDITDYKEIE